LRKDFSTQPSPVGSPSTTSTLPESSSDESSSVARLVFGSSKEISDTTESLPLASASVSAERSAPLRIFLFTRIEWSRGRGPWATPPPTHCGDRIDP
jgi:hypothetical protein